MRESFLARLLLLNQFLLESGVLGVEPQLRVVLVEPRLFVREFQLLLLVVEPRLLVIELELVVLSVQSGVLELQFVEFAVERRVLLGKLVIEFEWGRTLPGRGSRRGRGGR